MVGGSRQARPRNFIFLPHSPHLRRIPATTTIPSPYAAPQFTASVPQFTSPVFVRRVFVLPINTPRSTPSHSYSTPNNPPSPPLTPLFTPQHPPPPAHFVRRLIRFPSSPFARILPSPLARIHHICVTFSPRPAPQGLAHWSCREGCDRMIVFLSVRQFPATS